MPDKQTPQNTGAAGEPANPAEELRQMGKKKALDCCHRTSGDNSSGTSWKN
jgi:hypothetical protein